MNETEMFRDMEIENTQFNILIYLVCDTTQLGLSPLIVAFQSITYNILSIDSWQSLVTQLKINHTLSIIKISPHTFKHNNTNAADSCIKSTTAYKAIVGDRRTVNVFICPYACICIKLFMPVRRCLFIWSGGSYFFAYHEEKLLKENLD